MEPFSVWKSKKCNFYIIQINHKSNMKSIWLEGFRKAWKQLNVARGEAEGNCQLPTMYQP